MIDSWYITSEEQKKKFWDAYPYMNLAYTRKLPNPNTFNGWEWRMPVADRRPKLVKADMSHMVQELKFIRFHKTKVTFALPNEPLQKMFIWVQKDMG